MKIALLLILCVVFAPFVVTGFLLECMAIAVRVGVSTANELLK